MLLIPINNIGFHMDFPMIPGDGWGASGPQLRRSQHVVRGRSCYMPLRWLVEADQISMDWFVGENLNRKPELFSHEIHGAFRLKFSPTNQSIENFIWIEYSEVPKWLV